MQQNAARRDGRAMWLACNHARFPATRQRVFCELKIMKIVILIYQIMQEKFAYGKLFMLVMKGYIFMLKMVKKKMQNSGLEIIAGLARSLSLKSFLYGSAVIPCGAVAKFLTGHGEARGSILRRVLIFSLSQFSVCLLASASL